MSTEEKQKRSRQAVIDTVRKGGIGSDRVTRKYKRPSRAFSWLKDPEEGEKYWRSENKLAKGGKATHGYGKAFMKGGRAK